MSRQIEQEDIGNRRQTTGADGRRGRLKDCGGDYEKNGRIGQRYRARDIKAGCLRRRFMRPIEICRSHQSTSD